MEQKLLQCCSSPADRVGPESPARVSVALSTFAHADSATFLKHAIVRTCSEVPRKAGYKGEQLASNFGFPVDAATLPGFCACIACFLQNRSVSADAMATSWTALEYFNKQCNFSGDLLLLPGRSNTKLKVQDNRVLLEDWSRCTAAAGFEYLAASTAKLFGSNQRGQ